VPNFNSYGSRRGNDRVMTRGTFANIRLKNNLVPGVEGGYTLRLPEGKQMTIFEASLKYKEEATPLIVLAGKEYGAGSSRDWAAKGPRLLGVRAVIAESFERIHRSNLIGLGILPLRYKPGENAASLSLSGRELYFLEGIEADAKPKAEIKVRSVADDGTEKVFWVDTCLNTRQDVDVYKQGGILHAVVREMA